MYAIHMLLAAHKAFSNYQHNNCVLTTKANMSRKVDDKSFPMNKEHYKLHTYTNCRSRSPLSRFFPSKLGGK